MIHRNFDINLYAGAFPKIHFNERIRNFDNQVIHFINEDVALNPLELINLVFIWCQLVSSEIEIGKTTREHFNERIEYLDLFNQDVQSEELFMKFKQEHLSNDNTVLQRFYDDKVLFDFSFLRFFNYLYQDPGLLDDVHSCYALVNDRDFLSKLNEIYQHDPNFDMNVVDILVNSSGPDDAKNHLIHDIFDVIAGNLGQPGNQEFLFNLVKTRRPQALKIRRKNMENWNINMDVYNDLETTLMVNIEIRYGYDYNLIDSIFTNTEPLNMQKLDSIFSEINIQPHDALKINLLNEIIIFTDNETEADEALNLFKEYYLQMFSLLEPSDIHENQNFLCNLLDSLHVQNPEIDFNDNMKKIEYIRNKMLQIFQILYGSNVDPTTVFQKFKGIFHQENSSIESILKYMEQKTQLWDTVVQYNEQSTNKLTNDELIRFYIEIPTDIAYEQIPQKFEEFIATKDRYYGELEAMEGIIQQAEQLNNFTRDKLNEIIRNHENIDTNYQKVVIDDNEWLNVIISGIKQNVNNIDFIERSIYEILLSKGYMIRGDTENDLMKADLRKGLEEIIANYLQLNNQMIEILNKEAKENYEKYMTNSEVEKVPVIEKIINQNSNQVISPEEQQKQLIEGNMKNHQSNESTAPVQQQQVQNEDLSALSVGNKTTSSLIKDHYNTPISDSMFDDWFSLAFDNIMENLKQNLTFVDYVLTKSIDLKDPLKLFITVKDREIILSDFIEVFNGIFQDVIQVDHYRNAYFNLHLNKNYSKQPFSFYNNDPETNYNIFSTGIFFWLL